MKKILITLLFILSSSIFACAAESSKTATIEDPDLKLSIEELRKKYPIDWLEKKYGKVNPADCLIVDDEPESGEAILREVTEWPCGSVCEKYPQKKNCSKSCSDIKKKNNLVCTFYKGVYENNSKGEEVFIEKPVAQFSDFSIEEIKSAFVHYDPSISCEQTVGNCSRIEEVVAITFINLLNKTGEKEDMSEIKNLFFSKLMSEKFKAADMKYKSLNQCKFFFDNYLRLFTSKEKPESFCSNFKNQ